MRGFRAKKKRYVAKLDDVERDVLEQVVAEVALLLGSREAIADPFAGHPDAADDFETPPYAGASFSAQDLGAGTGEDLEVPQDPALRRLLPEASDDPELAAEFRRLTEPDLRRLKVERLRALARAFRTGAQSGTLRVPKEHAGALAATFNDVRLVLADRLGLETEEDADRLYRELELLDVPDVPDVGASDGRGSVPDDPDPTFHAVRRHLGTVYAALTWWQESLLAVMVADLDDGDAR